MAAYDEALAEQILWALQEVFPKSLSSFDLKACPPFVQVPEDQFLLALDALLKSGLISGKPLRTGYNSALDAAACLEINTWGRASLSTTAGRGGKMDIEPRPSNSNIHVTVGGECFEASYIDVGNADGRDGVLYYFKLRDLVKDRGLRNVSLFRSGMDKVFVEHYDARVETVRLNVLRRAFDSGTFSFETLVVSDRYHELPLKATDFKPRQPASDESIRRFLKTGGYWLGYKYLPAEHNAFIDFDCPQDLDYLGATVQLFARNLKLLSELGYFRGSSVPSNGISLKVIPTAKLIEEIESADQPKKSHPVGGNVTQNIHLHGPNSRLNLNSTDNSVNITSISNDKTFVQMRDAAQSIADEVQRANILSRLNELESARGTAGFTVAYQTFIATAANYMTIFGPFIPALTQMLSGS